VSRRPYVLLSTAMSVDGRIDAPGPARLVLSGAADLDRVDAERAASDAIMVGAGTIRRDDPRLLIRSAGRRAARAARGLPGHPIGVTITASGDLDPAARFFAGGGPAGCGPDGGGPDGGGPDGGGPDGGGPDGGGPDGGAAGADAVPARLVYCATPAVAAARERLGGRLDSRPGGRADGRPGGRVEIIDAGDPARLEVVLADLAHRGIGRLMVEGGAALGTEFLTGGLVDELQLVIAPFFVGDPAAPRFAGPGGYPHGPDHRMTLAEVRQVGEVVLLRYLLAGTLLADAGGPAAGSAAGAPGPGAGVTAADRAWLARAIDLSRRCPPSSSAFSVGAVLVSADGEVMATGFSREKDPHDHAEEAALATVDPGDPRLAGATLYSSLEPCRFRASRPRPCADLIIAAGLRRVVIAWLEPPIFVPGGGAALLREAGVTVVEVPGLAAAARAVNQTVLGA
jgi:riboflavin biosynthesis pyrimidine reductase/pyrimidine deaminase RibD-like protein